MADTKSGINKTNPNPEPPKASNNYVPGEGIRSMATSRAFRALNFELYAKPNKFVMALGLLGITTCIGMLAYMNFSFDRSKYYVATTEDGSAVLQPKRSRWDS